MTASNPVESWTCFACHRTARRCFQTPKIALASYLVVAVLILLYWFCKAQRRRLDGFYARCLRRILRIPAAYYSRVSNQTVFGRAGVVPLTRQLARQQMLLLGQVARAPANDPLRRDTFVSDSLQLRISQYIRRVGRPRQNWTEELLKLGSQVFGGEVCLKRKVAACSCEEWLFEVMRKM